MLKIDALVAEFEMESPPAIFPHQYNLNDDPIGLAWQEDLWALRKAGLGLLLSRRSYSRAIAFIEDLAVPVEKLRPFIADLQESVPWPMGIYGHVGEGCLHTRPYIQVNDPNAMGRIFEIMPQIADLVRSYGGTLTSEHGDGLARSWLNPRFYSEEVYKQMVQVKQAFDPHNLMNPGKIVEGIFPQPLLRHQGPLQSLLS